MPLMPDSLKGKLLKPIDSRRSDLTHIRSFAASFRLLTFCHSFMLAAEEVLSLSPSGCPASFPKKDAILGFL